MLLCVKNCPLPCLNSEPIVCSKKSPRTSALALNVFFVKE